MSGRDLLWIGAFIARTRLVKRSKPSLARRTGGRIVAELARFLPFPIAPTPDVHRSLPRVIWMYWHDGEAASPDLVRRCIRSWREANPGWEIRVLDAATARELIDLSHLPSDVRIQLATDVLRIEILREHGGVWVADVFFRTTADEFFSAGNARSFSPTSRG
ncbi:MAG: capsular polysaccharide synthesis protein [Candidatus Binatia bacterium]